MLKGRYFLYPSGTRGFLYYHWPSDRPRISGEIRFRITPSDNPASFSHGYDLPQRPSKFRRQKPWCLSLLSIPQRKSYNCILTQLESDGLITNNLAEVVRNVASLRPISPASHLLFTLSDPLEINYANSPVITFRAVTEQSQHEMYFKTPHCGPWTRPRMKFNSGIITACFERSTLPENEGSRVVVLRCLDVVESLVIESPKSNQVLDPWDLTAYNLIQGQLLQTLPKGKRRPRRLPIASWCLLVVPIFRFHSSRRGFGT
ncbi:hypothetical protein BJ165DRAFT_265949 [Panaeolus papilionaceus]|nr:hypothetical protein BJ165DRAFT_265949 [Panaeolus papilionaceus]